MKKTMMLIILSVMCGFLFADFALAGLIEDRSFHQRVRIRKGIISGELTPYETKILKQEQHHIRRIKKISWFDGKLTLRERRHIESLQNRASRHIYRLKHNDGRRHRRYKNSNWYRDR